MLLIGPDRCRFNKRRIFLNLLPIKELLVICKSLDCFGFLGLTFNFLRHDEKFDVDDLKAELMKVAPDRDENDGNIRGANDLDQIGGFLSYCFSFANMRSRKNKAEIEAYRMALKSKASWMTEKKFRSQGVFLEDKDTLWYELPELSAEQKEERFRKAERDVKWEKSFPNNNRGGFNSFRGGYNSRGGGSFSSNRAGKRTRWDTPAPGNQAQAFGYNQQFYNGQMDMFVPRQLAVPPQGGSGGSGGPRRCFRCEQPGHIAQNCRNPAVKKEN